MQTQGPWKFQLNTNAVIGDGALNSVFEYLEAKSCRKVGIIVDAGVHPNQHWQEFLAKLRERVTVEPYFVNTLPEPTYDHLDAIRGNFSADLDCLLGVGGGSTMDVSKAISVLITNPKPALSYRGFGLIENKGVPLILAPTTAGSGSEVTPYAVFIESSEQRKFGINTPLYLPVLTAIDPRLALSCPPKATLAAGMDALTHTLESFVARKHSPISRALSEQAFCKLFPTLPKVMSDPSNVEYRGTMGMGAYFAGAALFNSAAGPAGALSYPIGVLFGITHGLAGAVFLEPVIRFNVSRGYYDYGRLLDALEGPSGATPRQRAEEFVEKFAALCQSLDVPSSLSSFGVARKDIPKIREHLEPLWAAVEQNPVDMSREDINEILQRLCPE